MPPFSAGGTGMVLAETGECWAPGFSELLVDGFARQSVCWLRKPMVLAGVISDNAGMTA